MTGAELVTMLETMVDDSIDSDLAYQLLSNAKNKIEGERDWEFLKKLDSSQSASNAAKELPADWNRTLALYVNNTLYHQIPYEQKNLFANSAQRWYLDLRNADFYLLGSNLSGTVNHFYIYQTDDLTSSTSPVWPERFHKLLAFEMAELFFTLDQGEKSFSWDDRYSLQKQLLRRAMIDWDVSLKKRSIENAALIGEEPGFDLGSL